MTSTGKDLLSRIAVCEVCGEPATSFAVDTEEVEFDSAFRVYRKSGTHAYCTAHAQPGIRRNLDGTQVEIKTSEP